MIFSVSDKYPAKTNNPMKKEYFFYGILVLSALGMLTTTLMSYYLSYLFKSSNEYGLLFDKNDFGGLVIAQFLIMSICMLSSWYACTKLSDKKLFFITPVVLITLIAVICRGALIGSNNYTSNDVDRYLFDGKVAILELDPYVTNHLDPQLEKAVAEWKPPAEHMKYSTLYPPLALSLFSASAATGVEYAKFTWKLLVLAASLLLLLFSFLTLKKLNLLHHYPLVAFSPLLILEAGVGLHLDIFSALAVSAAVYSWVSHRRLLTSVILGLGALIKILPILCFLPLVLIQPTIKRAIQLVLPGVITIALGYAIAITIGLKPVGSLVVFFEKWRSGSPLFLWLDSNFTVWQSLFFCMGLAAAGLLLLTAHVYVRRQYADTQFLCRAMQAALAIPLLISPVIFPWYLMPLVPLLVIAPTISILVWTLILPLLYEVLGQFICCKVWAPATWPIYAISLGYFAMLALLINQLIQRRATSTLLARKQSRV